MCWSNIAKEGGKCPRHFFRLFDEQHMRPAWERGKTRRRDGVHYPLYDRRRFVVFARNAESRGSVWTSPMAYHAVAQPFGSSERSRSRTALTLPAARKGL
jgi:hypothetical protein